MDTTSRRRRTCVRAASLMALAALVLLVATAPASAAPAEPTLSLAELQTMLESGPVSGYMKTTVEGYSIEKIPVTVEGFVEWANGTLILAEADAADPVIARIGGVAAGMSGSPVYVDDAGVDKLIGALSYGSDFTIGGMFLATPIAYMAAIEADYGVKPPAPGVYKLAEPVDTGAGLVRSVVVARSQKAASQIDAKAGQAVMAPLAVLEIGGLPAKSRAFKELAARLEKQTGLTARPASSAGFWAGPPAPDLEAGSAVCELFSLGSVWYGAMGTVTYVNDGVAMSFGHDVWWTGPCGAAMTAGFVGGIWPSDWEPFMMINPRDVKGTITQDRSWGVAGAIGQDPDMIPVTAHVTFPEDGRDVTSASSAVEWAFRTTGYEDLPAYPILYALWYACDAFALPGSAETTTTVNVSDETGAYVVTVENLWDSYDITWDPFFDADNAVYTLAQDPDGVLDVRLDSIDFQATVSSVRRSARPVDITLAEPLHTGDNTVDIDYYAYGSRDLQTVTATLTIPEGTPVNGDITVEPGSWYAWGWYDDYESAGSAADGSAPTTLAEMVDELNGQIKNSDLVLTFTPRQMEGEGGEYVPSLEPIQTNIATDWVFSDMLSASTIPVYLYAEPARVAFGGGVTLNGYVQGVTADVAVDLYRVDEASGIGTLVETTTAAYENGMATFVMEAEVAPHNTTFVARVAAVDGWLAGSAEAGVQVRAAVRLTAKASGRRVALTAKVRPADTGGRVVFQRYSGGRWRTMKTVDVTAAGRAKTTWRAPAAGTYRWRAKFLGSSLNAAATSGTVRVAVR